MDSRRLIGPLFKNCPLPSQAFRWQILDCAGGNHPSDRRLGLHIRFYDMQKTSQPPLLTARPVSGAATESCDIDLDRLDELLERVYTIASSAVPKAIRRTRVLDIVPVGKSHLYNLMDEKSPAFDPTFPRPFRLGKSPNAPTVWWEHQIVDWLKSKASGAINEGRQG